MVEYRVVRLWADRVRMVQRYLEVPSRWPDGIDSKYGRWYSGHEDYWRARVGRLRADGGWEGGVDDEVAFRSWSEGEARAVTGHSAYPAQATEAEPWVEAGVSRATWYRRKAAEEGKAT